MKKVIILTGPGGSGKTAIAKLLKKNLNYTILDGDREDTEFFPKGGQLFKKNFHKLTKAHNKILEKTKALVEKCKKIVVDYIIFGQYIEFFSKFQKEFGKNLQIAILFPNKQEIISRDKKRKCWTTGEKRIKTVYKEFEEIQNQIGKDKYLDTSNQSAKESFEKYFKS